MAGLKNVVWETPQRAPLPPTTREGGFVARSRTLLFWATGVASKKSIGEAKKKPVGTKPTGRVLRFSANLVEAANHF